MKTMLASRPARIVTAAIASIAAIVAIGLSTFSGAQPHPLADFDTSPMSTPTTPST